MSAGAGTLRGAGLGLRRALLEALGEAVPPALDFVEVAPENWIGLGGRLGRQFARIAEQVPVALHGLSLDIGGVRELDRSLLAAVRAFMRRHRCPLYSEHLSYCADAGHLYDLLPLPFTEEAVHHVAQRIRRVQDFLGVRIAVENASYYVAPWQEMSEAAFVGAVVAEADCDLLVDVNNVYVNSLNHGYDAREFLASLPPGRVVYLHVAGHCVEADDLRIDTHGADVIDPVWQLLAEAYGLFGPQPTLLERDFNIPGLGALMREVGTIHRIQDACPAGGARGRTASA